MKTHVKVLLDQLTKIRAVFQKVSTKNEERKNCFNSDYCITVETIFLSCANLSIK